MVYTSLDHCRGHNRMRPVLDTSFVCFENFCMLVVWRALLTVLLTLEMGSVGF